VVSSTLSGKPATLRIARSFFQAGTSTRLAFPAPFNEGGPRFRVEEAIAAEEFAGRARHAFELVSAIGHQRIDVQALIHGVEMDTRRV